MNTTQLVVEIRVVDKSNKRIIYERIHEKPSTILLNNLLQDKKLEIEKP